MGTRLSGQAGKPVPTHASAEDQSIMAQATEHESAAQPIEGWRDALTMPNALSFARVVLGLWFPLLPPSWRLPVIIVAVLTDLLDGAAGRYFGVCSRTGKVLDPVADKIFM